MRPRLPLSLVAFLLCASSAAAQAETVSVVVMDSRGMAEEMPRRVVRMTESVLREVSGLTVKSLPKGGPPQRKGCAADAACLSAMSGAAGTDHVILVALSRSGERLFLDAFFVDVKGRKAVHRQIPEGRLDEPEASAKALVEAMLPAFARRGWGGLGLTVEPGAQVKIDGSRFALSPQEPFVALTSGTHDVDVVFADGRALMQRVQVAEGERTRMSIPSAAMLPSVEGARGRSDALLATSYGLFSAGALTIASAFIVATMSRSAARDVTPCVGGQSCTSFQDAAAQQQRAENLARNANILLGAGAALSVAGAGVFVFDLVRSKESP